MIQLYLLSVLCNGLGGYILFAGNESGAEEKSMPLLINNRLFTLVLGILSLVTGVLKLLSPFEDRIPILGDLLPAAAGVFAGIMLIFGIYRQDSSSDSTSKGALDILGVSLLRFRKSIGMALIAIALLHFLFPRALFL